MQVLTTNWYTATSSNTHALDNCRMTHPDMTDANSDKLHAFEKLTGMHSQGFNHLFPSPDGLGRLGEVLEWPPVDRVFGLFCGMQSFRQKHPDVPTVPSLCQQFHSLCRQLQSVEEPLTDAQVYVRYLAQAKSLLQSDHQFWVAVCAKYDGWPRLDGVTDGN